MPPPTVSGSISTAWQSFWHTMTSNDRHASHDSPYRTGQHVPLNSSRHDTLTSVTTAAESRPDLSSFEEEDSKVSSNGWAGSPTGVGSPNRPYSPGMRSLASQRRRSSEQGADGSGSGEIQMQSFHDGAPPPPPVSHTWKKIDTWTENNYPELFDQLGDGCTQNDVNELEHELDCSLPLEIRESLQIHDGQERGGNPTGILFGCMLLDCEEIVYEWRNWRTVSEEYFQNSNIVTPQPPLKAFGSSSSSSAGPSQQHHQASNPLWRQELLDRQESQPPRAIQKAYAHPGWIPLARDWGGNCIAVDLAPGPSGKWGQIIIFGRDYDCKYVIARSWAAFLAQVADDFASPFVLVEEETGELKFKPFKKQNVEPPYMQILRWRVDQKYGGRRPRRKSANGLGLNTNVDKSRNSPYGSPAPSEERGRSPHRFSNRAPTQSPKTQFGLSSPLARVTEEVSSPVTATSDRGQEKASKDQPAKASPGEDLLEMGTPALQSDAVNEITAPLQEVSISEKTTKHASTSEAAEPVNLESENLGEMKTVAI